METVKYKKIHPDSRLMDCAKLGDAGHDIGFVSHSIDGKESGHIDEYGNLVYYTGISLQMPSLSKYIENAGLRMQCFGFVKSSIHKKSLMLTNGVGVIDFGYRGEITFKFKPTAFFGESQPSYKFANDEFVGQLVFIPVFDVGLLEVESLDETDRGARGYGDATSERSIKLDFSAIVAIVCDEFKIKPHQLQIKTRISPIPCARYVIYWLVNELCKNMPEYGNAITGYVRKITSKKFNQSRCSFFHGVRQVNDVKELRITAKKLEKKIIEKYKINDKSLR